MEMHLSSATENISIFAEGDDFSRLTGGGRRKDKQNDRMTDGNRQRQMNDYLTANINLSIQLQFVLQTEPDTQAN